MAGKIKSCLADLTRASEGTATECGAKQAEDAAIAAFQKRDQIDAMESAWKQGTALTETVQKDYDDQTKHSRIRAKQTEWLKAIKAGLTKYPVPCAKAAPAQKKTSPSP